MAQLTTQTRRKRRDFLPSKRMRRLAANHADVLGTEKAPRLLNLRDYQQEALRRAHEHDGFCLFMEQRTGKTPVACELVESLNPDRLLIACPGSAIQVWENHLSSWLGLRKRDGTVILNLEAIWSRRKMLKRWIKKAKFGMVICDESHRIKDRRSKVSRALRTIARQAKYKLAMTGTPIEGKIQDAWAQYDFIDPTIFGDWKTFKANYLVMGGWMNRQVVGVRNREDFEKKFHGRFFRVLLEDVKPEKTDIAPPHEVRFQLEESRLAYQDMHDKFVLELNKMVHVKELQPDGSYIFVKKRKKIVATRVISQAMKLHQLTGGFVFDEEGKVHRIGNEKLLYCGALVKALGDVPIVIFVRFIPELMRISALMDNLGRKTTLISGQHQTYRSGDPFDVAIVQIRSGISIDLSHAQEAIFYSWTYSYLDYDQAKFRIRSYVSSRARYHYLIASNSIDEVLYSTVINKLAFNQAIVDKYRRS